MQFKLRKNVKVGDKVKTLEGWKPIIKKTSDGVYFNNGPDKADGTIDTSGFILYGEIIYGWKKG